MANRERKVDLRIGAKDEFSSTIAKLDKAQQRLIEQNKAIAQQPPGQLRKFYQDTQREVEATQAKIAGLAVEFKQLAQSENASRAEIAKLVVAKSQLQDKAAKLRASLDGVRQASHAMNSAQVGGFKAFNQNAVAMEREAAAARALASARENANARLRSMVEARAMAPVQSGFSSWSSGAEDRVVAAQESRAAAAAARRAEVQERLNNKARSGFADWSRYADTVSRIAATEERAAAVAARKAEIQSRLNSTAQSGFAAWSRSADGLTREATAATQTATRLNLVDQATKRVIASQNQMGAAADRATNSLRRQDRQGGRGAKGEQQEVEIYGLRPYQMVNLGYQVNDVISGLAMGQAPLQILAQQAGQFAQIWPDVMVGLVRSIPILLGTAAALAPFVAAAVKMKTEANSVKLFATNLALLADGSRYTASSLADITTELDRAGVAVDAARSGVLALVKEGFSRDQIRAVTDMARELSKISGKSFEEEVGRLGKAFGGNASTIRDLDRELQFLTASQLENIYSLDRAGRSAEALSLAQSALRGQLYNARQELTPWQQVVKDLSDAWETLVNVIEDSNVFQELAAGLAQDAKDIERVARVVERAAQRVKSALDPSDQQRQSTLMQRRVDLEAELATMDTGDFAYNMQSQALRDELVDVNAELATLADRMKAAADAADETAAANAAVVGETEEQLKVRLELQQVLDAQLETMRQETEAVTQTGREQFIQNKLLDAKNAALEKGLKLTEDQVAAVKEQAAALYDSANSAMGSGSYGGLVDRIIGVESGGNPNAKNPLSTATGLGQFIESTWLSMFEKYFPDRAENMTKGAILALRNDAQMSRQMIELYARENSKILQQAGVATNDAAVYLAHFLGPNGAIATLRASPGATTDQFLGQDQIAANASILQGKTAQQVLAWAERKMAVTDQEVAATQRLTQLDQDRAKEQQNYTESYRKRISDQQFELQMAGESARSAAIQSAIRQEELRAQKAGLALSKEQRAEIEKVTGAAFDRQNAETRVNELLERRSTLTESLQIAQQAGDRGQMESVIEQINQTEAELGGAIDAAILFYRTVGGPEADAAILKLRNLKAGIGDVVRDLETQFLPQAEEINEQLADVGSNAFSELARAFANGENAADSFFSALREGIANFLIEIGQAIVKQTLFNALTGGQGAGGGVGGLIASGIGSLFGARHTGGIVGAAANTRKVNPAIFADAAIHHSGGLVGRERPIIALEDEEVLTRDDERHVLNGGKGARAVNTKVVNVFDPADLLEAAMQTTAGEKVIMNFMSRNSRKIAAALS